VTLVENNLSSAWSILSNGNVSVGNYNPSGLNTGSLGWRADWAEIMDVGKNIRRGDGKVSWENVLKYLHVFILLGKSTGYCTVGDSGSTSNVGNRDVVSSEGVDYLIHLFVGLVFLGY
jgi:hypothetical protein